MNQSCFLGSSNCWIFLGGLKETPDESPVNNVHDHSNCIYIVTILTSVITLLLQAIVIYFLRAVQRKSGSSVGLMLSINLGLIEVAISLFSIAAIPLSRVSTSFSRHVTDILVMIIAGLLTTDLFFIKLFVSMVEVLKVYLDVRNNVFWTKLKRNCMLVSAWGIGVLVFGFAIMSREVLGWDVQEGYKMFIVPGTVCYIVLACTSNVYLLYKLNRTRITPHLRFPANQRKQSFGTVLLKSQFLVPVLVTCAFSFFLSCACVDAYVRNTEENILRFVNFMLFNGMIVIDGVIYLAFERRVRLMIKNRFRAWKLRKMVREENKRRCTPSNDSSVTVSSETAL